MADGSSRATSKEGVINKVQNDPRHQGLLVAIALVAGTTSSVLSKVLLQMHADADPLGGDYDSDQQQFTKPVALTLGVFLGMMLIGLSAHATVVLCRIPCTGYPKPAPPRRWSRFRTSEIPPTEDSPLLPRDTSSAVPFWMYLYVALPASLDLLATVLSLMGLIDMDVSVAYQFLRGTGMIFLGLLRQHALGRQRLYSFQWFGIGWDVASILLVSVAATIHATVMPDASAARTWTGIAYLMMSTFLHCLEVLAEEKLTEDEEARMPPLLLIGMEGLWGTLLCLTVLYPVAIWLPGDDRESFERPSGAWAMLLNNRLLLVWYGLYMASTGIYNGLALLLSVGLHGFWHFILDNFRPTTVWVASLSIYYVITPGEFGESWDNRYSFIQLSALLALLYGTLVFTAPDTPSIRLQGQWYALGLDLTPEYREIELGRNPPTPGFLKWIGHRLGSWF